MPPFSLSNIVLSFVTLALKGISEDMGDILIYALYPMTGLEFLKKKYNVA